jgi:hypothetical protein
VHFRETNKTDIKPIAKLRKMRYTCSVEMKQNKKQTQENPNLSGCFGYFVLYPLT